MDRERGGGDLNPAFFFIVSALAGLYFVPASLTYLFSASSFATGFFLVSAYAWLMLGMGWAGGRSRPNIFLDDLLLSFAIIFFVTLHVVAASQIREVDFGRAAQSILLLILFIVSASLFADTIFMSSDSKLSKIINVVGGAFLVIGACALLGFEPPMATYGEKPTFPYTEPSFFAFTFAPILFFLVATAPLWRKMFWLSASLALALALSNLTLLVVFIVAALLSLPWLAVAAGAGAIFALIGLVDLSYFTSRISFSENVMEMTNISSLVYIQGWQMMEESLRNTGGWGVGFQQLGLGYTNVPASVRINQLLGFDLNLNDGGFIAAKLVSEFGIVGIIITTYLLYRGFKSMWFIRRSKNLQNATGSIVFAHASIAATLIEILVRGTNYFTGTLVVAVAALMFLSRRNAAQRVAV